MNFMTSVLSAFGSTKTVLNRENDRSHENLGRLRFESGRGRPCFAGPGPIWFGRAPALRVAGSSRRVVDIYQEAFVGDLWLL